MGRICQCTSSCLDSVVTSRSHLLPTEQRAGEQRGPELLYPPQEASTSHSQASLDLVMAVARSRDSSCPSAAFPASLLPHCVSLCLQHFYSFLGEGAEQPLHFFFFSSFFREPLAFCKISCLFPDLGREKRYQHFEEFTSSFSSPNYITSF